MKTRIKHPIISGSVYIAEAVIKRLERSAGRRCGCHEMLYEQFFSQEVMGFAAELTQIERNKFLAVVADIHSGFDALSYFLIPDTIAEINETYHI